MRADCLLFANGRTGNTDKLNLSAVGLSADSRGQLSVDSNYQTDVEHIYAQLGDVIGYPSLASAAYDQGRFVAQAIEKGQADSHLIEDIPTGIYTIPEIPARLVKPSKSSLLLKSHTRWDAHHLSTSLGPKLLAKILAA